MCVRLFRAHETVTCVTKALRQASYVTPAQLTAFPRFALNGKLNTIARLFPHYRQLKYDLPIVEHALECLKKATISFCARYRSLFSLRNLFTNTGSLWIWHYGLIPRYKLWLCIPIKWITSLQTKTFEPIYVAAHKSTQQCMSTHLLPEISRHLLSFLNYNMK